MKRYLLGKDWQCLMQSAPLPSEVSVHLDSWDARTACQMITIGISCDHSELLEGGAGLDQDDPLLMFAHAHFEAYTRALFIAESSINIGAIKEIDTPQNWIKWARRKGYPTAHLLTLEAMRSVDPADEQRSVWQNEKAFTHTAPLYQRPGLADPAEQPHPYTLLDGEKSLPAWIIKTKEIHLERMQDPRYREMNFSDKCRRLEVALRNLNIRGRKGAITFETLRREFKKIEGSSLRYGNSQLKASLPHNPGPI